MTPGFGWLMGFSKTCALFYGGLYLMLKAIEVRP